MHLYWRIIEELKFLGETWALNNPNLLRSYRIWIEKHRDAITLSLNEKPAEFPPLFTYKGVPYSLS